MEVKIGITDVPREVVIDTTVPAEEITERLRTALAGSELFDLVDEQGRRVLIPAARIAYLDLGSPAARTVGFGAV